MQIYTKNFAKGMYRKGRKLWQSVVMFCIKVLKKAAKRGT